MVLDYGLLALLGQRVALARWPLLRLCTAVMTVAALFAFASGYKDCDKPILLAIRNWASRYGLGQSQWQLLRQAAANGHVRMCNG
jgi:hypothetical protein